MAPSANIYYSEPAVSLLASSSISHSTLKTGSQVPPTETSPGLPHRNANLYESGSWNLELDLKNGIQCSTETVFRSGSVIGLSRLRNGIRDDDTTSSGDSVGQLSRYILSKHLLKNPPSHWLFAREGEPNTFIIHPPNFGPFAPESLLSSLLSTARRQHHNQPPPDQPGHEHEHPLSREEAIRHLDSVQLLPGFDFPTTAQSISKVSDTLHGIQNRQQDRHDPFTDRDSGSHPGPILFIVTGLDSLAEGVVRTSNTVKATAMLTTILRTLTRLARAYASFLSVFLVNTGGFGVGTATTFTTTSSSSVSSVDSSTITRLVEEERGGCYRRTRDYNDDDGGDDGSNGNDSSIGGSVQSVFGVAAAASGPGAGSTLFPSLLMKVLDQGVDAHLLLSTMRHFQIVEVIKDRVGDGTGKWCVWGYFP